MNGEAGKGDAPRKVDSQRYRDNYEGIDWEPLAATKDEILLSMPPPDTGEQE